MQPQAFLWLQLKGVQFSSSNRTRTAVSIQHQGMHKTPLRVFFLEHPYSTQRLTAAYSGIFNGLGEIITPLLSA
ncbi:hypothetical protein D3C77_596790 [compost metagenome]